MIAQGCSLKVSVRVLPEAVAPVLVMTVWGIGARGESRRMTLPNIWTCSFAYSGTVIFGVGV